MLVVVVLVALMQVSSASCAVPYAVDVATAADSSPIMPVTMAHSSHVTYTGADSATVTTAWLTTTLNLRVPRVADHTSFVADVVVAPTSVHAPLDHSCH